MFSIQRTTGDINIELPDNLIYFYRIYCTANHKSYIGRTTNVSRRIQQHLNGEGSPLLLYDLVEYGRKSFHFSILDVSNSEADLNAIEDKYIHEYDALSDHGYNQRLNCDIIPQPDTPINLNEIKISAKFNFTKNNNHFFSVGELTNARSYQIITNLVHYLHTIDIAVPPIKNKTKKFNYFQITCDKGEHSPIQGCIYSITLKYCLLHNVLEILELIPL